MKIVAFLGALTLLGGAQLAAQDRFSLTGDRVAIYNVAGEIQIESTSGTSVIVEVNRGGAQGDQLEVRRREEDGWQQLIVRYPSDRVVYERRGHFSRSDFSVREDGSFGLRNLDPQLGAERIKGDARSQGGGGRIRVAGSGSGLRAHADMRILIPAGRAVSVHLGVGKVFINNLRGDLQVDTRSGSIDATGLTGFARLNTGAGSITLRNATGDFGLHTGSGGVRLERVARGALVVHTGSGSVEAESVDASELEIETGSGGVFMQSVSAPSTRVKTGSGGIRAQRFGARNFDLDTGSGSIRAELVSDVQTGRVETGSGSVQIALPADLGAEVTVDTGSGGIDVAGAAFTIRESRRQFLRGSIGDGSGTLRVSTGSGGVSFRSY